MDFSHIILTEGDERIIPAGIHTVLRARHRITLTR